MTKRHVAIVLLGCALGSMSCSLNVTPTTPKVCSDQAPPKLILNDQCKDGVCGFTCEPGRWAPVHLIIDDRPFPREPLASAGGS